MTRWKMVPVEATDEMFLAGRRFAGVLDIWDAMLAAAPKWEPSEADIDRVVEAESEAFAALVLDGTAMHKGHAYARRISLRAAILAAVGGDSE